MMLTVHMMTAVLAPGDAIGNYIASLTRILRDWGVTVYLYTDYPNPHYPLAHYPSHTYQPTGHDLLWTHFSIDTPGLDWLVRSPDFKILDSHGVTPPELFHGYDAHMEALCAAGAERLRTLASHVDLAVCHTDYISNELHRHDFTRVQKLPLVVDTTRFNGQENEAWAPLLAQLDYLLFVGRVVPQKGLAHALRVFAALHRLRPEIQFFVVGSHPLGRYSLELEQLVDELGIGEQVVFTGPLHEAPTLSSFYKHARFYLCLSDWESFCVPLVESLHFGTPILGHNVAPIPETMGGGGILLEGPAEQMATHIHAVWDDDALRHDLKRRGQAHAAQFTDAQLGNALLDLFRSIANGNL